MELHKRRKAISEPETRYFLQHVLLGVKFLPRAEHHPPRPEAGQPLPQRRNGGQGRRLRPRHQGGLRRRAQTVSGRDWELRVRLMPLQHYSSKDGL